MLLQFERHLETLVIRHSTVKAIIHHCISDVNASGEDLVQMSTHLMGGCTFVKCQSEIK